MRTNGDILRFADAATAALAGWWERTSDRELLWTVKTYYGDRPAWELLERQTWHSAQHARQLQSVLEGFGLDLSRKVEPALYQGLPMPAGLWE